MPITPTKRKWLNSPKGRAYRWRQKLRWRKNHREKYLIQKVKEGQRRNERHRNFWNNYKSSHPCTCGESDPAALQFHHLDPTKKNGVVSRLGKSSISRGLKELSNCITICANCHAKGHAGRPQPEHKEFFPEPTNMLS